MSSDPSDHIENGRIDLVPMIDCIMLLLLFFIMTTKFSTEEKAIASLLPTDKGQAAAKPKDKVEPPQMVNIVIVPSDGDTAMPKFEYERDYMSWYTNLIAKAPRAVIPACDLRIGGDAPLHLVSNHFNVPNADPKLKPRVQGIHDYIHNALKRYEVPGKPRKDQPEIVIHCFSALSWRYAIIAYDACRAFEAANGGIVNQNDPRSLENARGVSFAPPRIRNYSVKALGAELFEMHRLQ